MTGATPTAGRAARHTVRALLWGWRSDLTAAFEYRTDLLSGTLVSAFWLGISITPSLVVAAHTNGAGGWTLPRLLFVQAVWYLMDAVLYVFMAMNINQLSEQVQLGMLDALLLRPVNSLVLCSLGTLGVQDLPKIVLAAGVGSWAVIAGGGPESALAAVAAALSILSAMVLMWAAGVLTHYKAISQVRFDGMFALIAAHNLARTPTPLYGPTLRFLLTAVVPVAFLATVPAQVFFGDASAGLALISLALAGAAVAMTSVLWKRELRRYSGAMG